MTRRPPKRRKKPAPKARRATPRKPAPRKKAAPKKRVRKRGSSKSKHALRNAKRRLDRQIKRVVKAGWKRVEIDLIEVPALLRRNAWKAAHDTLFAKRSAAAKKGAAKRTAKRKLLIAMRAKGWRETALPTKDELVDYLGWLSDEFEIEISDMYRLYFGYDVGEAAE